MLHKLACLPVFFLWVFTWCCFFGCQRQVVVTQEEVQTDTVETRIVRLGQVSGQAPDIGETLAIPDLDIRIVRVSDSVLIVHTPVRRDTRHFVRHVSTRQVFKNAFNSDSNNDINNKRAIQNSPESGNKLKRSQHRSQDSGNSSKRKNGLPWWLILLLILAMLGIIVWNVAKPGIWKRFM